MKPTIIVSTNTGSLGKSTTECSQSNKKVRSKLSDTLLKVSSLFGVVQLLLLQESGGYDHRIPPVFDKNPISSNENYSLRGGRGDSKKRGVITFSDIWGKDFLHLDIEHEICTTISSYRNKRNKDIKFATLNLYRNISCFESSESDIKKAIFNITDRLRKNEGVRKFLITGDFNSEKFVLGKDFRELTHHSWYHQHNKHSAKTKIDKAFTNLPADSCGILEILPSTENVEQTEDQALGHKVAVFWVGVKPVKNRKKAARMVSLKILKDIVKNARPNFVDIDERHDNVNSTQFLDKVASDFSDEILKLVNMAKINARLKVNPRAILIANLEGKGKAMVHCSKTIAPLYKYMSKVKSGMGDTEAGVKPTLSNLCKKLEDKLYDLIPANWTVARGMVEILFPKNTEKKGIWPGSIEKFQKMLMSVSNSGALDFMGISLRMTKICFSRNILIVRRYKTIAEMAFKLGYFPKCWKIDQIGFIYKRKGSRMDPGNWRPITISPSLGKHLERAIANFISNMDDKNGDNHAYTARRSCLTAILHLQKVLRKIKNDSEKLKKYGYKLTPVISTDDISGAFESIEHNVVADCIGNTYLGDDRNIRDLVLSYFDRKCEGYDRESDTSFRIFRRYPFKTSPQGSLISPKFWRIYDGLFSEYYKRCLDSLVNAHGELHSSGTIAYADDHVTVIAIITKIDAPDIEITRIARKALLSSRHLLGDSTIKLGCKIHPTKSENVIPKKFHSNLVEFSGFKMQRSFKWLGYKLNLTDEGEIEFDRDAIATRLVAVSLLRDSVFQYTADITLKWQIFKTYLAPYIELYLPLEIQESNKPANSDVYKFQHDCICKVLGVSFRSSRIKTEKVINELPVRAKAIRMAKRMMMSGYAGEITRQELGIIENIETNADAGRVLRSGRRRLDEETLRRRNPRKWDYIQKLASLSFEELQKKLKFDFDKVKIKCAVRRINSSNQDAIIRRLQDQTNPAGRARQRRRLARGRR